MEYIGHPLQIRGAERIVMQGGKSDGMHFLMVRNGKGLEALISIDRCADLMRVTYKGYNMGYMSPCGNVAPSYYDDKEAGFLKSFTAGFFTTAGLTAVGSPCTDNGEILPLHGTIANTPAELTSVEEDDEKGLTVKATVRDCCIFGRKMILKRTYFFSYQDNTIEVRDSVKNESDTETPFMILYHCNMGYPLLSENSEVKIPNHSIKARNKHAQQFISQALEMQKPTAKFEECCYYYDVSENNGFAKAGIFNPEIGKGTVLKYKKSELPYFTEWKMMGKKDYVLGLEPGNCTPDGRDVMRKQNKLQILKPDEYAETGVKFIFTDGQKEFEEEF